jgi:hypothetical protein
MTPEEAKLAWMRPSASESSATDSAIRFDLSGNVLSEEAKASLPTSAGLHHHGASPDLAGYTIDDILWLSRSTVPSQRITMLSLLGRILGRAYMGKLDSKTTLSLRTAEAKRKAVEMTTDILMRPGSSVGLVRVAVDVLYEALGGSAWQTRTDDWQRSRFVPDTHPAGIAIVPFEELVPRMKELLGPNSTLPDMSIIRLIIILQNALFHSSELAEQVGPSIPAWVVGLVSTISENPSRAIGALRLLYDTVEISRPCAQAVVDAGFPARLSRFLMPQAWSDGKPDARTFWSLRILTGLGRYGLATSYVTASTDVIRSLGQWVQTECGNTEPDDIARLIALRYFQCLTVWTTCAIDPHKTTPEHALTWAQASSMDWAEEATSALVALAVQEEREFEMAAAVALCEAWAIGAKINGERAGEDELGALVDALNGTEVGTWPSRNDVKGAWYTTRSLAAILSLDNTLVESGDGLHILSPQIRKSLLDKWTTLANAEMRGLRYQAIRAGRLDGSLSSVEWSKNALALLPMFDTGDEPEAMDLLDQLLKHEDADCDEVKIIEHPDKLQILRPLLQYTILPGAALVVGPTRPSHAYLKATTTLRQPAFPDAKAKRAPGLPLPADWAWSPLDILLESASSPALAQAPPDWTPAEVDIVRATLLLARRALDVTPLSHSLLLFNLMKVFMLEHNSQSAGVHVEIFRDEAVAAYVSALLAMVTTQPVHTNSPTPSPVTMETASTPFLGPEVPFYSWYSDFVTLYEAVSYGDPSFSQLVLAPQAMAYPTDFRKLLWVEHSTALRSIRTRLDQLLLEIGGLEAYFFPAEEDQDVLAGYVRALNAGWVTPRQEALYKIAVWHVGSYLWREEGKEEVRKGLLGGLVQGASPLVLRESITLDVSGEVKQWGQVGAEEVERRTGTVQRYLGDSARDKVARALQM